MFCKNCAYYSPVTGILLLRGKAMQLIEAVAEGLTIRKVYLCPDCGHKEVVTK